MMSLYHPGAKMAVSIITWFMPLIRTIPVNPPEIVTIKDDEFKIDLNRMAQDTPYVLEFQGSRFLIQKNKDGAMTMDDLP